jgi:hypothetical protein
MFIRGEFFYDILNFTPIGFNSESIFTIPCYTGMYMILNTSLYNKISDKDTNCLP